MHIYIHLYSLTTYTEAAIPGSMIAIVYFRLQLHSQPERNQHGDVASVCYCMMFIYLPMTSSL